MTTANTLNSFGYLLQEAKRLLSRRFEEKARHYGLTSSQWRAIAQLSRTDGLTQVALANYLEIEPMTVCRLVDRLEARGFIERIPDPADRRAKLVWLTEKSRSMMDVVREIAFEVYEEAFAGFSESERAALVEGLKRISANLSEKNPALEEEPV
jgi:MarR family transcriptional regulator, transcriptional regulator for hemolysin